MTNSPLLHVLLELKTNGPVDTSCGICGNVETLLLGDYTEQELEIATVELPSLISQWPDRIPSMGGLFPVEGGPDAYRSDSNKWQNPRRIALLDWLIAQLEQEEQHG